MSPRLRAAFAGVRQRILPAIVQQEYARAKAAFDRQDYATAIAQFDRVLRALGSPDLGAVGENPPLADLRTLANGFRDLSIKAATPPPPPPQPVLPPAPVAAVPPNGIYGGLETGIMPPVVVRQTLPAFPLDLISRNNDGILEVVISETGAVESAVMRTPINPRYDQLAMVAAKTWKYRAGHAERYPGEVPQDHQNHTEAAGLKSWRRQSRILRALLTSMYGPVAWERIPPAPGSTTRATASRAATCASSPLRIAHAVPTITMRLPAREYVASLAWFGRIRSQSAGPPHATRL